MHTNRDKEQNVLNKIQGQKLEISLSTPSKHFMGIARPSDQVLALLLTHKTSLY